jgi:hypothetical protein
MNQIQPRSIGQLTPHPALKTLWELPADDTRFLRLVESVASSGILDPLKVTADGRIIDGRHRWRAAKAAGLDSVPCVVVDEGRLAEIAMETRLARRHLMSKSQVAYEMYPLFARRHQEALNAHTAGLAQRGGKSSAAPRIEDLAAQAGVGRDLFKHAAAVHREFSTDPSLREEWEPKIMAEEEPMALGAVLAGIAGARATRGKTPAKPARNSALHRWDHSWEVLGKEVSAWERWSEEERGSAAGHVKSALASMPDPVLDVIRDALRATRRARHGGEE